MRQAGSENSKFQTSSNPQSPKIRNNHQRETFELQLLKVFRISFRDGLFDLADRAHVRRLKHHAAPRNGIAPGGRCEVRLRNFATREEDLL
jgi:hypothetical protein